VKVADIINALMIAPSSAAGERSGWSHIVLTNRA
jgi:hypothetical protein